VNDWWPKAAQKFPCPLWRRDGWLFLGKSHMRAVVSGAAIVEPLSLSGAASGSFATDDSESFRTEVFSEPRP